MLSAIDAILLKKIEKLKRVPLQGCISVLIISLTLKVEKGQLDVIATWFFIFNCFLILLIKDIFIK